MAPSAKQVEFWWAGYSIDIPAPLLGYSSTVSLPMDVVPLDDGSYSTRCEATTYDKRWCECEFWLNEVDGLALQNFVRGTLSGGVTRQAALIMTLPSNSGFFPFGPDKGDTGSFTVNLTILSISGIGDSPWRYFRYKVRIENAGAYPAYSIPTGVSQGSFTFGTVTNCRFPQEWFYPTSRYAIHKTMLEDGTSSIVDRGSAADSWTSAFTMTGNESKTAALLNYITGTVRGSTFTFVAGNYYYPFGADLGDNGTFTARLISGEIIVKHSHPDTFSFGVEISYVSGPT